MEKPLVDKQYLLEKYPGKGGWTYAVIPEVIQNKNTPFGWVKVYGKIDSYELVNYKLMPMGNNQLFLPVKAAIRKTIRKEAGDLVHIVLFPDSTTIKTPQELIDCFSLEDARAYQRFLNLTEGARKQYIDWIYEAKKEETKLKRIVTLMKELTGYE